MCSFILLRCAYFGGHDNAFIAFFFSTVVYLTADQLEFLAERQENAVVRMERDQKTYVHLIDD